MYRVDQLAHTADVGYQVTADTLPELFRGAADGLLRVLRADDGESDGPEAGPRAPSPPPLASADGAGAATAETWTLERPDRERLLVSWLRELLYRITAGGRFPSAVSVEMTGASALEARLEWEPEGDPERLAREIKGVTYHGLDVERREDGEWHARLVLDV